MTVLPSLLDLANETVSSAPGTGSTISLSGTAVSGPYLTWSNAGAVNGTTYRIMILDGNNREEATAVYNSSGNQFTSRTTLIASVNGTKQTTAINATSSATIGAVALAEDIVTPVTIQPSLLAGFRNKFRNGTMDVWQRGTSGGASTTAGATTQTAADGWYVVPTGGTLVTFDATNATTAPGNFTSASWTLSNGNLTAAISGAAGSVTASSGVSSGKFYMEFTCNSVGSNSPWVGIFKSGESLSQFPGDTANSYGFNTNGNKYNNNNAVAYGNAWTGGNVIGVAYDATGGNLWFSIDGTWQNSATITEIQNGTTTHAAYTGLSGTFYPSVGGNSGNTSQFTVNFGASPYAHTVPTGFGSMNQVASWAQAAGRSLTANSLQITGNTPVTDVIVKQRIEGAVAAPLTSQIVTVQTQVFNNTGGSITPTLTVKHANTLDTWSATTTDVSAVSLQACANSAWTQVSYTFTDAGHASNGLEITFDFGNNFSTTGKSIKVTELDLSVTPLLPTSQQATAPPAPELRSIPVELEICQRYFATTYGNGVTPGSAVTAGMQTVIGDQTFGQTLLFPQQMRAAPTMSYFDGAGNAGAISDYNGSFNNNASTITGNSSSVNSALVTSGTTTNCLVHYTASAEL